MKNLHSITTKEEAIEFLKANVDNNDAVQDCLILIDRFNIPFDEVNKTIDSVPEPVRQPRMPKGHSDNSGPAVVGEKGKELRVSPKGTRIVVSSNEVVKLEPKDIPDADLLTICKMLQQSIPYKPTVDKYFIELFDRFDNYRKVQSLFAKISKRDV